MINYRCEGVSRTITCHMTELYNDYGELTSTVFFRLNHKKRRLRFVVGFNRGTVVAIPELRISFYYDIAHPLSTISVVKSIIANTDLVAIIFKTIEVMECIVKAECEHVDISNNFANLGITDYSYYTDNGRGNLRNPFADCSCPSSKIYEDPPF